MTQADWLTFYNAEAAELGPKPLAMGLAAVAATLVPHAAESMGVEPSQVLDKLMVEALKMFSGE